MIPYQRQARPNVLITQWKWGDSLMFDLVLTYLEVLYSSLGMAIGDVSPFWPSMQQSCVLRPSNQWTWHPFQHQNARAPPSHQNIRISQPQRNSFSPLTCSCFPRGSCLAKPTRFSFQVWFFLVRQDRRTQIIASTISIKKKKVKSLCDWKVARLEEKRMWDLKKDQRRESSLSFVHSQVGTNYHVTVSFQGTWEQDSNQRLHFFASWLFSFSYMVQGPPLELQAISSYFFTTAGNYNISQANVPQI